MSSPSNDVDNISESATHGTAQGSCAPSSQRRNSVRTAERATYSGSIDSLVSTTLHDTVRLSNQETQDSPGFGDVDTTLPREEIRAPIGALPAANNAASQARISQNAGTYREPQAQFFQETHPGPQVGRAQTSTLDEVMVDSETTVPLTTNSSSTNSQELLEWKAQGRPRCPTCLKSHFGGFCNMTKWESDLLKRDPKGYARYRKRMAKTASRRNEHSNRVAKQPGQAARQSRQQRETRGDQGVLDLGIDPSSPFLLHFGADAISRCSSVSELEDMQRTCAQHAELAMVGQMAAAAQQERRAAKTHSATPQTVSSPQQDTIADEVVASPPPAQAPHDVTLADSLSPFCLQYFSKIIEDCSTISELEQVQRLVAQRPDLALVGHMASVAQQEMMLAQTYAEASQTADTPQQDTVVDEAATSPPSGPTPDDATPAATSSTNGYSVAQERDSPTTATSSKVDLPRKQKASNLRSKHLRY